MIIMRLGIICLAYFGFGRKRRLAELSKNYS